MNKVGKGIKKVAKKAKNVDWKEIGKKIVDGVKVMVNNPVVKGLIVSAAGVVGAGAIASTAMDRLGHVVEKGQELRSMVHGAER